jgi:hypothetical protein
MRPLGAAEPERAESNGMSVSASYVPAPNNEAHPAKWQHGPKSDVLAR